MSLIIIDVQLKNALVLLLFFFKNLRVRIRVEKNKYYVYFVVVGGGGQLDFTYDQSGNMIFNIFLK